MRDPAILSTLETKIEPQHTAVLIIDMCNDFIDLQGKTATRGGRPLDHARRVIEPMQRLLAGARSAGVRVVYVQHTTLPGHASDSGPWLDARSRADFSVADICIDGSWGQQIIDELEPRPDDVIIKKHRYSGFAGTNLDMILRSLGIQTVVCAGVSTNACVEATAREAFSADYYVVLPEDACGSWSVTLHEATLETARKRYATVCNTDDATTIWAREES